MFEIHTKDLDITSGALEITWCLDKDLLNKVKGYADPLVVITVIPENKQHLEKRFVVPLNQMMAYITFRNHGKNKIYAHLQDGNAKKVCVKYSGSYATDLVYDGEYTRYVLGYTEEKVTSIPIWDDKGEWVETKHSTEEVQHAELPHANPLEVDVPIEYFGKEPSKWEKAWVLWLISDKGVDQCAFRKRKIFAYTLQVLVFLVNYAFRVLLTLGSLVLGFRGFSIKYLLHPLNTDLNDTQHGLYKDGIIFVRPESNKWKDKSPKTLSECSSYVAERFWSLLFFPPILILLSLITLAHKWLAVLGFLAGGAVTLLIIVLFASGLVTSVYNLVANKVAVIGGENDLEDLICTGEPLLRKPKNRSLKLRYLALKSKVCKPFPG